VNGSLGAARGRVNGSLGAAQGRVNGSQVVPRRGRTNGAGPLSGTVRPANRRIARRTAALILVAALLLPSVLILAAPAAPPQFAADGDFREWGQTAALKDADLEPIPENAANLVEVRVAADERKVFVYAKAEAAWFSGAEESVVRIFVDRDGDALTGFDLGDLGADLMLEAAGKGGALLAQGRFEFDPARQRNDWKSWLYGGPGALAVVGDQMEAAFAGNLGVRSVVLVAASSRGGDDLQDPPVTSRGAVVVHQAVRSPQVVEDGAEGVPLLEVTLSAVAGTASIESIAFAPSGTADFGAISGATLEVEGSGALDPIVFDNGSIQFRFGSPLLVGAGETSRATLVADFDGGRTNAENAGASFGAKVVAVGMPDDNAPLVLRPRALPPGSYLGYVSTTPVIDGAFGEWRLASAAADPVDTEAAPGSDLIGVRAMTFGGAGAFFAETRGPVLAGAPLSELPLAVERPTPGVPAAAASVPQPPAPKEEAPPLSADDRVLLYLDADRDPQTGFRPAFDVPIGAEFVVQVAGRFSSVATAQLLRHAGASPFESAWSPVAELMAAAAGSAVEGEIPAAVFGVTGAARVLIQTVSWSGRTGDLSDALQDAVLAPTDPDTLLHFRAVTFDPLAGPPPVREALLTEVPSGYWVVQLNGAPQAGSLASLEAVGATLYGYVHSNAYLAKMDEPTADTLRSMPDVRWVGIYQPAFKFPADPASWGDAPLDVVALLFERPRDLEERIAEAGGSVLTATDLAVRVRIDSGGAEALGFVPEIQFVEPEHQRVPLNDVGRRLQGVNLTLDLHGLNGTGIVVGISDSGVDFTHPAFDDTGTTSPNFDGRIVGYFKYGGSYGDSDGHGTHTAGSVLGDGDLSNTVNNSTAGGDVQFRGMAPAAKLVETEIFDGGTPADDGVFADQQAYGATVSSNSWGYIDGMNNPITDYDTSAYLTDVSVIDSNISRSGLQPMIIVFAAGNDGSGANTVGSPSTAKNVLVVGATETDRGFDTQSDNASQIAGFSSRGPTDDGRIRPDVVAVGTYVLSTQSRTSGCTCTYGGWDETWTGANYAFSGGTSMATPMVAGIAALFQQHINETFGRIPSPALVRAALINGAEDMGYGYEFTGGVTGPMSQGWGRVNITRAIDGPPGGSIMLFEEGPTVGAGDVAVRRITSQSASTPLKVTLVWTDEPGNPGDTTSLAELSNDLDLVVRAPNGTFYRGNKFQGSWSRANNSSFDRLNNVENVFVQAPAAGTWTVEVSGFSFKSTPQNFALAISGNVTEKAPPSLADTHGLPGSPANAKFGWNATASGSVNGDAYRDLIVGAPGTSGGNGAVYIFFGGVSANLSNLNASAADVVLSGASAEAFGSSVDASGDFDADGFKDLLIGAPGGGKAYLFYGGANWASRTANVTFTGSSADQFGAAVRLAPVDNHTGADALIGAPLNESGKGAASIFSGYGASGTWNVASANGTLTGNASSWRLGTSISAGDADGDGSLDMLVGAPGASVARLARGGVAAGSIAFNATLTGIPGSAFGQSVALDGDFNGDGKDDALVGAPLANGSAGAAYVFLGRSPLSDEQVIRHYFFDDMESGVLKWEEMSGESVAASTWSLSSSVYYGPAATGNSWQDSSGNYGNDADRSIAFNGSVNLSAATSPVLTFAYRADVEDSTANWDGFLVKYSTNNGSSWTHLDSTNAQKLYDRQGYDPPGPNSDTAISGNWAFTFDRFVWRTVSFNISSLAGNSVKFRFQFASDGVGVADGIYIDDVAVREAQPSSPNYTVYGEAAGDRFGWAVASLGDISGDGNDEFGVGAPLAPSGLTSRAGAAFVFLGSASLSGSAPALDAAEALRGGTGAGNLGWSLSPIVAFNASGATFLFAGSPGLGSGSGGATIGNATAPIPEFSAFAAPVVFVASLGFLAGRRRRSR